MDDIVQNLEGNIEIEKEQKLKESKEKTEITKSIKTESNSESIADRKFNLPECLGQCMERENKRI